MSALPEIYPNQPARITEAEFNRMLACAVQAGASDTTVRSGCRVFVHLAGRMVPITQRRLENSEVELIARVIYGENALTEIRSGRPIDPSYSVRLDRNREARFRVNATGCFMRGADGVEITIRTIPQDPPSFADLSVEQELAAHFVHPQGLGIISGPTGSGKTTLLAAAIRSVLEAPEAHKKIITYEAPIEFTFDRFDDEASSAFVSQSEIPRHIKGGFHEAVRNAMRRASSIMLFGECRDRETMATAMEGANTGHMVYTTLHALGVGKTFFRIGQMFQGDAQEQMQMMLLAADCMRVMVSQCLLKRVDQPGKRVCLREYLVFTPEIREELLWCQDPMSMVQAVRRHMSATGRSIEHEAERLYHEGVISQADFLLNRMTSSVMAQVPANAPTAANDQVASPVAKEAGHVA